jgi:hypothetical protein
MAVTLRDPHRHAPDDGSAEPAAARTQQLGLIIVLAALTIFVFWAAG